MVDATSEVPTNRRESLQQAVCHLLVLPVFIGALLFSSVSLIGRTHALATYSNPNTYWFYVILFGFATLTALLIAPARSRFWWGIALTVIAGVISFFAQRDHGPIGTGLAATATFSVLMTAVVLHALLRKEPADNGSALHDYLDLIKLSVTRALALAFSLSMAFVFMFGHVALEVKVILVALTPIVVMLLPLPILSKPSLRDWLSESFLYGFAAVITILYLMSTSLLGNKYPTPYRSTIDGLYLSQDVKLTAALLAIIYLYINYRFVQWLLFGTKFLPSFFPRTSKPASS